MSWIQGLPTLNAVLNGTSAILLVAGYAAIRRGRMEVHRTLMLAAFTTSAAFLVSYLIYHYHAGSRPFEGVGWMRPLYFVILITHVILAAVILPMALITLHRGLGGRFDRHRRIARWTLPTWLYVSVTGIIVYVMLYHL